MAHVKVSEAPHSSMVSEVIIGQFRAIAGSDHVIVDEEQRHEYGHDKTEDYQFLPDLVIKPRTPQEISEILKICNHHKIPTTPRGAGTGLSGGSLPVKKLKRRWMGQNMDFLRLRCLKIVSQEFQSSRSRRMV